MTPAPSLPRRRHARQPRVTSGSGTRPGTPATPSSGAGSHWTSNQMVWHGAEAPDAHHARSPDCPPTRNACSAAGPAGRWPGAREASGCEMTAHARASLQAARETLSLEGRGRPPPHLPPGAWPCPWKRAGRGLVAGRAFPRHWRGVPTWAWAGRARTVFPVGVSRESGAPDCAGEYWLGPETEEPAPAAGRRGDPAGGAGGPCVCVCVCLCAHVCACAVFMCLSMSVCARARACTCRVCLRVHVHCSHVSMQVHARAYMCACACCTCLSTSVCMHVYMRVHVGSCGVFGYLHMHACVCMCAPARVRVHVFV